MSEQSNFHTLGPEAVLAALNSKPEGLSREEAQNRLEICGYNELTPRQKNFSAPDIPAPVHQPAHGNPDHCRRHFLFPG